MSREFQVLHGPPASLVSACLTAHSRPLSWSRTAGHSKVGLASLTLIHLDLPSESWHHKTRSSEFHSYYKNAGNTSIRASTIHHHIMAEDHHDSLSPPPPGHHAQEDPGAHEMGENSSYLACESILLTIASIDPESEDNFTDAQSQTRSRSHSRPESPIPITRVERVDHDAAYGEVPGTDAYEMRTEDARPDEIAFIPEDEDKLNSAPPSGAVSPGGHQIPKTVVEEVPASPVINSLSRRGTLSSHKRNPSDAMPDLVLQVEDTGDVSSVKSPHSETLSVPDYNSGTHEKNDDTPGMSQHSHFPTSIDQVKSGSRTNRATSFPSLDGPSDDAELESQVDADNAKDTQNDDADEAEDDGFGDFDDFEQEDENAEFGDFDEADFQEAESAPKPAAAPVQSLPQIAAPLFVSDSRVRYL